MTGAPWNVTAEARGRCFGQDEAAVRTEAGKLAREPSELPKEGGFPWGAHRGPHSARADKTSLCALCPRRQQTCLELACSLTRSAPLPHSGPETFLREHFLECGLLWPPASSCGKWERVRCSSSSAGDNMDAIPVLGVTALGWSYVWPVWDRKHSDFWGLKMQHFLLPLSPQSHRISIVLRFRNMAKHGSRVSRLLGSSFENCFLLSSWQSPGEKSGWSLVLWQTQCYLIHD